MISEDQQRIIIALAFSIPFSFILKNLPNSLIRHIFSSVFSTILLFYIYGMEIWIFFALSCLVYLIIKFRSQKCGALVTIFSLSVLSIFHIYRMVIDYGGWKMDLTTVLMGIICKYSLFAYAVEDGHDKEKTLTLEQENNKIEQMPSFFIYLSYCLFLPTMVIGTVIQFRRFQNYMEKRGDYEKIPSPWQKILNEIGYLVVLFILFFISQAYFSYEYMKTESFLERGILYIFWYPLISITLLRSKYYFAWKYSMIAVHASGISFQKLPDGTQNFLAVETCNPEIVQSTMHVRVKIANWNMGCQYWLRRSIYERFHFKNKTYSQLLTFMVSAFWHGFYGGYYISFFFWFCQIHLSTLIFNQTKVQSSKYVKFYKSTGIIGKVVLWVVSAFLFNQNAMFFQILSLKQSLNILNTVYLIPQIVIVLGIVFFTLMGTKKRRPKTKEPVKVKLQMM